MTLQADRMEAHRRGLKYIRLSGAALPPSRVARLSFGTLALAGASDDDWVGSTTRLFTTASQACVMRNTSDKNGIPVEAADAIAVGDVAYLAADGMVDSTGTIRVGIAIRGASAAGQRAWVLPD